MVNLQNNCLKVIFCRTFFTVYDLFLVGIVVELKAENRDEAETCMATFFSMDDAAWKYAVEEFSKRGQLVRECKGEFFWHFGLINCCRRFCWKMVFFRF